MLQEEQEALNCDIKIEKDNGKISPPLNSETCTCKKEKKNLSDFDGLLQNRGKTLVEEKSEIDIKRETDIDENSLSGSEETLSDVEGLLSTDFELESIFEDDSWNDKRDRILTKLAKNKSQGDCYGAKFFERAIKEEIDITEYTDKDKGEMREKEDSELKMAPDIFFN